MFQSIFYYYFATITVSLIGSTYLYYIADNSTWVYFYITLIILGLSLGGIFFSIKDYEREKDKLNKYYLIGTIVFGLVAMIILLTVAYKGFSIEEWKDGFGEANPNFHGRRSGLFYFIISVTKAIEPFWWGVIFSIYALSMISTISKSFFILLNLPTIKNKLIEHETRLPKNQSDSNIDENKSKGPEYPNWVEDIWNWAERFEIDEECVPRDLDLLVRIKELDISTYNSISYLPRSLKNIENLETLILGSNPIKENLEYLEEFQQLKHVHLVKNQNADLILKYLIKIDSLEELSIIQSNIERLPENIGTMKNLKILNFASNSISYLPTSIKELKSLTHINLNCNKIEELPDWLHKLEKLEVLFVNNNLIRTIPTSLCFIDNLDALDLSKNPLNSFPKEFSHLEKLRYLYLNSIELTNLPEEIFKLKALQTLQIEANKIKKLPDEIIELSELAILNINDNPLEFLPEYVGSLSKLECLYLSKTQIKKLPSSIIYIKNLSVLHLPDHIELSSEQKKFLDELKDREENYYAKLFNRP